MPKSSKKLTFRIFADDTNMFYSSKDPEQLQSVINEELGKVLKFCAANMLSINFRKTNYIIITSPKKETNIRILQLAIWSKSRRLNIWVFLLMNIDLKWDAQLQHINNKITKNSGISFKLRHYVPIRTLKLLYCVSQNNCIRCIFFANKRDTVSRNRTLHY